MKKDWTIKKLGEVGKIFSGNSINDKEKKKCYGLLANMDFLLVSEYEENGTNPELIIYKKR